LIFTLPERPVFIDGRYVPYLGGVLDDYRTMVGLRPGWRALVDKYRVSELLLGPEPPLAVARREDGWRVRASDASGRWIVLARPCVAAPRGRSRFSAAGSSARSRPSRPSAIRTSSGISRRDGRRCRKASRASI